MNVYIPVHKNFLQLQYYILNSKLTSKNNVKHEVLHKDNKTQIRISAYVHFNALYRLLNRSIKHRISYTSARTEEETRSKKSDKKIIIFKHVSYKNVEHGGFLNKIMHFIIVILLRL